MPGPTLDWQAVGGAGIGVALGDGTGVGVGGGAAVALALTVATVPANTVARPTSPPATNGASVVTRYVFGRRSTKPNQPLPSDTVERTRSPVASSRSAIFVPP